MPAVEWPQKTWEKAAAMGKVRITYGENPKYGGGLDNLCSEFVSWYYYQAGIKVNGKSLRDIAGAQRLHDLFKAEGNLYRYNSGTNLAGLRARHHRRPLHSQK